MHEFWKVFELYSLSRDRHTARAVVRSATRIVRAGGGPVNPLTAARLGEEASKAAGLSNEDVQREMDASDLDGRRRLN